MSIRCPTCFTKAIQKSRDGKVRIRTKIVAFDGQTAEIVCKQCGSGIPVDLQMGPELRKALNASPKLIIKEIDTNSSAK